MTTSPAPSLRVVSRPLQDVVNRVYYQGFVVEVYLQEPEPPITDNWQIQPTGSTILRPLALTSFKGVIEDILFQAVTPLNSTFSTAEPLLNPLIFCCLRSSSKAFYLGLSSATSTFNQTLLAIPFNRRFLLKYLTSYFN